MMNGRMAWRSAIFVLMGMAAGYGQMPGHGVHPPMPDTKLYIKVQQPLAQPPFTKDVPLQVKSTFAGEALSQSIDIPGLSLGLRAVHYLPSATMQQETTADDGGTSPPAIELAIEGPTQSFRRWLSADDPERNRLMSYIATWRYMSVSDAALGDILFRQFETEFTRPPTLTISDREGKSAFELEASPGQTFHSEALGVTATVQRFFPDYAIDKVTLEPSNQSDRRRNPAAQVEIRMGERVENRWIFSKFPDFSHAGTARMPVRVTLECPMENEGTTPDFAIVTLAKTTHEVWTRTAGKASRVPLIVDQTVSIPGSTYGFRVVSFLPSARLLESYKPADKGKGKTAVEIAYSSEGGGETRLWLEVGQSRRIAAPNGGVWVGLTDQISAAPKGHP